jgi:hypothetical protein
MVSNRLLSTSCSINVQPRVCVAGLELVDGIRKTSTLALTMVSLCMEFIPLGKDVNQMSREVLDGLRPWLRQLMLNFVDGQTG